MKLSRRQILAGAAGTVLLGGVANATSNRAEYYEVTETELPIAGIDPAHDGLRIAQLSDVHVGTFTPDGRVISAVRQINALKPDLAILTGDFVTNRFDSVSHAADLLANLTVPTFVVLGNHDHWVDPQGMRQGLEKNGYAVLQNRHTVERFRGAPLTILGVDDGYSKNDDVQETFKGAAGGGTRLVLTHLPSTSLKLPENAGVATFTGHTHGAQVLLPGITRAILGMRGETYYRGHYVVRGNHLYVNRGLGYGRGGPLLRIGSEPELSVFTLRYREPA